MNTILVGRHFLYFLGLYFIIYEGTLGIFIIRISEKIFQMVNQTLLVTRR
jgi:hypothetical protein